MYLGRISEAEALHVDGSVSREVINKDSRASAFSPATLFLVIVKNRKTGKGMTCR